MRLESPACFPFCTKTSGTQTAQPLTPQRNVFGVRLRQNMKVNAGGIAQLRVSSACEVLSMTKLSFQQT